MNLRQSGPTTIRAPPHTGYAEPGSALERVELFTVSGAASAFVPSAESPRFLHADFAAAIRAALPSDPVLGPLAAAAQPPARGLPPTPRPLRRVPRDASSPGLAGRATLPSQPARRPPLRTWRTSTSAAPARAARPSAGQALCALARRLVWWPGLPAAEEGYVRTCQRAKADHAGLPDSIRGCPSPAGLLYNSPRPRVAVGTSASTSWSCPGRRPLRPRLSAGEQ